MAEVYDYYGEENYSASSLIKAIHPAAAGVSAVFQSFQIVDGDITTARFFLHAVGPAGDPPIGNLVAQLYTITGTHGVDAVPNVLLGQSLPVSMLNLPFNAPKALVVFTFSPAIHASGVYAIVLIAQSGTLDATHYISAGRDQDAPTHAGNWGEYSNGAWVKSVNLDLIFYVEGGLGEVYLLNVDSSPSNIEFIRDGESATTPYSESLPAGNHVITMPANIIAGNPAVTLYFLQWSDGDTNLMRTINLDANKSVTALYVVQVTASPDVNYVFSHWLLDGVNAGSQNPTYVKVNISHTLQAMFVTEEGPSQNRFLLPFLMLLMLLAIVWIVASPESRRRGS